MSKHNKLSPIKGRISEELLKKHPHVIKEELEEPEIDLTKYFIQIHNPTDRPISNIRISQVHSENTASIEILDPGHSSEVFEFEVIKSETIDFFRHGQYPKHHAGITVEYEQNGEAGTSYFVPPYALGARKVKVNVTVGAIGFTSEPVRRVQTHDVRFLNRSSTRILEIGLGHVGSSESIYLESLEPGATSETMKFTIGYPLPNEIIQISWSMLPLRYMKDGDERTFIGSGVLSNNSSTIQVVFDNEGCRFDYS